MLLRCAEKKDIKDIHQLAVDSGVGITTLPADKNLLSERVDWSIESIHKKVTQPTNEYYFFVLEDPVTHQVVGTSAIEAFVGHDAPFYTYKLSRRTRICHALNIRADYDVLTLVNDKQGCSELCTLFLSPKYRHHSNGLLLSRARFLFISQFPERFANQMIAEMRGISDDKGHSPFWDAVGHHFFQMPFEKADALTLSTDKQFIADLMPRHPLYVQLIASHAQKVIGEPHQATKSAMRILEREGFSYHQYIDIFDGGPTIESPTQSIQSIKNNHLLTIKSISDEVSSQRYIISNTELSFRATVSHVIIDEHKARCIISKNTAELLKLNIGDNIRIIPLRLNDQG